MNKFNRYSIRLKDYDYSTPGEYFVTICTYDHKCYFGNIVNEEMRLSQIGEIAKKCCLEIPNHFSNVELDEFVVMPNHLHGIIILFENDNPVGTRHAVSLHEHFGKPTKGSIPTIVRSFKSATTKQIHELIEKKGTPIWQSRYYEHIIRNEKELNNIRDYIANNPVKWYFDKENSENR